MSLFVAKNDKRGFGCIETLPSKGFQAYYIAPHDRPEAKSGKN